MAKEYVKLTLEVTVEESEVEQISKELCEALDILGNDFSLFDDSVEWEETDTPEEAPEDEEDEEA
jgi:F0F1-type ATP synthase delta subunit